MSTAQAAPTTLSPWISKHRQLIAWWLPLLLICIAGLYLCLAYLGSDLPYNNDPDEPYWYAWTQYLRVGGVSHLQEGSGYPPGILVLLAGEQWAVELLRGEAINAGVGYFVVGRLVSVLFRIGSIVLAAGLARTTSHRTV